MPPSSTCLLAENRTDGTLGATRLSAPFWPAVPAVPYGLRVRYDLASMSRWNTRRRTAGSVR
jgi:hypothetical protein